jgi:DNA-binding XRE family transcriptional regulator
MSGEEFRSYTREEFLDEFFPDTSDSAAIAAGMEQLRAEQRAYRLAEMRRRLGFSQAQVAARMGVTQGRVSAIENANPEPLNCAPFPPTPKPSAAGSRSSPTSATSAWPSPNQAPKPPDPRR